MSTHRDELDQALDAFATELSQARLPTTDSPVPGILTRIQSIRKQTDPSQTAEQLYQVRAELIEFLRAIEQSAEQAAKQTAKESADSPPSLSAEQQERIQQRLAAILEFAFQQTGSPKKASGGELAWLARLRV